MEKGASQIERNTVLTFRVFTFIPNTHKKETVKQFFASFGSLATTAARKF